MNKEANFLYSVGLAGFALLNGDGSMPTACLRWEDVAPDRSKRQHEGGLISKLDTFDFSKITSEDLSIKIRVGSKEASVNLSLSASNSTKVTASELASMLNSAFSQSSVRNAGISLKADTISVTGGSHTRVYDTSNSLPFYTPISLSGVIPQLTGLQGYIFTEEVKSVKHDFDKEQGKSVDVTSGRGMRCVVKETDKIKGINLTISMAGQDANILSMVTGSRYNAKTDEFFLEGKANTPSFAFIYFVKAFAKGENNESSFEKVRVVCFPSCQAALPGDNAQEGSFSTTELTASGAQNKKSNLPLMFYKGISVSEYNQFVESI